ncbi:SDR family NAD(P)-dependent oxidoreductase [Rhizobium sp. BK602]|uniref:SDR family NAD(P)-dependent oxidoreductase n=1 Tax=Rhizobium sp. BK602 TaxID=2586986 RepID=UPI00160770A1|nr:SDR family NAD(P)-dependent oxidoreductase [Rhizobium sp. BK602]MBB3613018.1 NAD(P)-dependent dehydrogenase (short-subunit alcohol dehydrogenase family) [Rhizobium sp. BK602]
MQFSGKIILIVGASSGMGRVLARRLAGEGAKVIVTARREPMLIKLAEDIRNAGGECWPIAADASDTTAAENVVKAVVERYGRIDMAYLNAGGAPALDMRLMDAGDVNAYMRSNYDVVVNYLFPILKQMMRQGGGHVAHTNSLAGFLGVPLQGPYSAAKGAAILLIDTCRIEFARYGIKFTTVYPGFVATEATANDGMPAPLEISAEKAVDHIMYALRNEKVDYLFPFVMRWLIRLAHILPKPVILWILRKSMPELPDVEKGASTSDQIGVASKA